MMVLVQMIALGSLQFDDINGFSFYINMHIKNSIKVGVVKL
jgi:hypothetical protein